MGGIRIAERVLPRAVVAKKKVVAAGDVADLANKVLFLIRIAWSPH